MGSTTLEGVPPPGHLRPLWRRRFGAVVLALLVAAGALGFLGDRTRTVSAIEDGYTLTLTYSPLSRSGLAATWELKVAKAGGFTDPIEIAVSADYFAIFEHQGLNPQALRQTSDGAVEYWVFDPPPGATFVVAVDQFVEPGRRYGASGTVALVVDGERIAPIEFTTRLLP
ncbi:MAG TPA: hypothetical protein VK024_06580 [Actinomycetaceae bacterium]|nr:hypothetical protein [Actinomycetaceae bacterium]